MISWFVFEKQVRKHAVNPFVFELVLTHAEDLITPASRAILREEAGGSVVHRGFYDFALVDEYDTSGGWTLS